MPKFCIVMPTFNSEATIEKSLLSIISQNYTNFDLIIVDNQSTDQTLSIASTVAPHAKIISRKDRGIADALNYAFDKADADIFCWLNSDDEYCDTKVLERVSQVSLKNVDACWFYGNSIYRKGNARDAKVLIPHNPRFSGGLLDLNIFTGSLFFRSEAWRSFKKFDISYKLAFEYELIKHLKNFRSARVPFNLAVFNFTENSLSSKFTDRMVAEALKIDPSFQTKSPWYYLIRLYERSMFN